MILFINAAQANYIEIKLLNKGKVVGVSVCQKEFMQAELLLPMIEKILKKFNVKPSGLAALAVVTGPGAFSALRIGLATANALAFLLNLPLIELNADQVNSDSDLITNIRAKKIPRGFKPAVPQYGREPNITKPKNI